jgi:hypothetical protein
MLGTMVNYGTQEMAMKVTAAIYTRKSNGQGDRDERVLSVTAQEDLANAFIAKKGWARGPAFTDTMTGVHAASRPAVAPRHDPEEATTVPAPPGRDSGSART